MRASSDLVADDRGRPTGRVLPGTRTGCMGVEAAATAASSARDGAGQIERESAMKWIKPAFDEIKMDAEAKSYSGEGFEE
jgi:hypothetical protein